jgi:hypothetical protein
MPEIDEYWQAIQDNVCAHCIDGDGKGLCRISSATKCGLKHFFPEIVNTVRSVQSENLGPYVRALRENVCSMCEHQSADGSCVVRSDVDCGLDRYFPLIVESIEGLKFGQPDNNADGAGAQ